MLIVKSKITNSIYIALLNHSIYKVYINDCFYTHYKDTFNLQFEVVSDILL